MLTGIEAPGEGSSDNCYPLCCGVLRPPGEGSSDNCYPLCKQVLRPLVKDLVIIVTHCVTGY